MDWNTNYKMIYCDVGMTTEWWHGNCFIILLLTPSRPGATLHDVSHFIAAHWFDFSVETSITEVIKPSPDLCVMRPERIVCSLGPNWSSRDSARAVDLLLVSNVNSSYSLLWEPLIQLANFENVPFSLGFWTYTSNFINRNPLIWSWIRLVNPFI